MFKRKKEPTVTASEVAVMIMLVATMDTDKIADTKDGATIKSAIYKAQSLVERTQTANGWQTFAKPFTIVNDCR